MKTSELIDESSSGTDKTDRPHSGVYKMYPKTPYLGGVGSVWL